jgi:hypothetical protein
MKFKNNFLEFLHQIYLRLKWYFKKQIISVRVHKHIYYYTKIFGKTCFIFKTKFLKD